MEELYTTRMLGLSYLQRNQLPEAEAEFKKLTKLAPDDPLGYANLGLTYLQAGRYAEAEKQLRARARARPGEHRGRSRAREALLAHRTAPPRRARRSSSCAATRPSNAHVLYALAELEAQQHRCRFGPRATRTGCGMCSRVAPANLAVRLKLVDALARRGEADSVVRHLEEVRRIPPEPPQGGAGYLDSAIQLAARGKARRGAARRSTASSVLMEVTAPYQASLEEVKWTEGPIAGRPVAHVRAEELHLDCAACASDATVDLAKFVDATGEAGFPSTARPPAAPARATRPTRSPPAMSTATARRSVRLDVVAGADSPSRDSIAFRAGSCAT